MLKVANSVINASQITGVLPVVNGGTGVTTSTGTGNTVLSASPTLTGAVTFAAGTASLPALTTASDLDTGVWFPAANTVAVSTNATERTRITSDGDFLVGTTVSAGEITNTIRVKAGIFNTISGGTSAVNNTATTLVTLSSGLGTYIISLGFNGVGDAATYSAVSIVNVDTTTTKKTDLVTSTGMVITLSGLAIQGRQTTGATLNISWSVLRIQ